MARRVKVRFDAEVEIDRAGAEPAAAGTAEGFGTDHLGEADHVDVELARAAFLSRGNRDQDVLVGEVGGDGAVGVEGGTHARATEMRRRSSTQCLRLATLNVR